MSVGPDGSSGQFVGNTVCAITWRNVMISENERVRVADFFNFDFLLSVPDNRFFNQILLI